MLDASRFLRINRSRLTVLMSGRCPNFSRELKSLPAISGPSNLTKVFAIDESSRIGGATQSGRTSVAIYVLEFSNDDQYESCTSDCRAERPLGTRYWNSELVKGRLRAADTSSPMRARKAEFAIFFTSISVVTEGNLFR